MTKDPKLVSNWILIVSGIFAALEIMVSIMICVDPHAVIETVDVNANSMTYVLYMWASRQFALGFIFGFATFKRSRSMLTLSYIFFLVMFIGDCLIGIAQKEMPLIISAIVMCVIASTLIFALNKRFHTIG